MLSTANMYDRTGMSEPLIFNDDIKIFSRNAKRSIFVRDLPYCCTSADLGDFFAHALSTPVLHAMVCRNKQGRTLQIGYVLFQSEEAVHVAMDTMNARRFIGRDIRVLPYDPKAPSEPSTTGLVHVSFKTMAAQHPLVTEATIRRAFEVYGELEHVAIRTHKYTDTGLQGGYGFVTFRRPDLNRYVIEQVRQVEVAGVLYDCSWSSLHTHKGVTGEEIVIDPRYGYLATKPAGSTPSSTATSITGASSAALGRSVSDSGYAAGGRGGPAMRERSYPGGYSSAAEYDEYYAAAGRRDPREEYYYGGGGRGGGGGYDYDRRMGGGRPGYGPGAPPPPPRAYYDEPVYDDYYRGGPRGHAPGRPPYAAHNQLYDRGYYEESYRGSMAPPSRYGGPPGSLGPRPPMSGRDNLDFPLGGHGRYGPAAGEERYGRGYGGYDRMGADDLFGGSALPPRSSLLGDDLLSGIPPGAGVGGERDLGDSDLLGGPALGGAIGVGGTRRSDSIGAVSDAPVDFNFDLGRAGSSAPASTLSAAAFDFYPRNPVPGGSADKTLNGSGLDMNNSSPATNTANRPSRASWETDLPGELSSRNGGGDFARGENPAQNMSSFWESSSGFFKNKVNDATLDGLIDDITEDPSSASHYETDKEIVSREASLHGPPGLLGINAGSPSSTKKVKDEGRDGNDKIDSALTEAVDIASLDAEFASKTIIQ